MPIRKLLGRSESATSQNERLPSHWGQGQRGGSYTVRIRALRRSIILLALASFVGFLTGEVIVRARGRVNEDGQFFFAGERVRPYALPYNSIRTALSEFENANQSYLVPEAELGWTIGRNARRADGLAFANSIGIRSPREFSLAKPPGTVRIALFGDSFVHDDAVPFRESWAHYLEEDLPGVEVMNFGVSGYGIDQAFLRWKILGRRFMPDVVIIGFQPENCKRNVNVIRKFYYPRTSIPFSKPRFLLEDGALRIVNQPTVPYRQLPALVRDFTASKLAQYEYFFRSIDYEPRLLYRSRFYGVLVQIAWRLKQAQEEREFYAVTSKPSQLCLAIMDAFVEDASRRAQVYILHLPYKPFLTQKRNGAFVYHDLLAELKARYKVIDPTEALLASGVPLAQLMPDHYRKGANRIVARVVADELRIQGTFKQKTGQRAPDRP